MSNLVQTILMFTALIVLAAGCSHNKPVAPRITCQLPLHMPRVAIVPVPHLPIIGRQPTSIEDAYRAGYERGYNDSITHSYSHYSTSCHTAMFNAGYEDGQKAGTETQR